MLPSSMGTSFVVSMLTGVATLIVTTASLGTGPHEASAAEDAAVPSCRGRTATIVGTDRNDRIKGSPGPDVIVGRGGDDVIRGEQGNDVLCGGYGNDELVGLAGNDRLSGGPGEDGLFGVGGNDIEVGGRGNDLMTSGGGDAGADVLVGAPGWTRCSAQVPGTTSFGEGLAPTRWWAAPEAIACWGTQART